MVITRRASARRSRVHFSSDDIHVTVRKSPNSDETDHQSLRVLVESKCPSLLSEFSPAWWLFNTLTTCRLYIVLQEIFKKSIKSSMIGISPVSPTSISPPSYRQTQKLHNLVPLFACIVGCRTSVELDKRRVDRKMMWTREAIPWARGVV